MATPLIFSKTNFRPTGVYVLSSISEISEIFFVTLKLDCFFIYVINT